MSHAPVGHLDEDVRVLAAPAMALAKKNGKLEGKHPNCPN